MILDKQKMKDEIFVIQKLTKIYCDSKTTF